MQKYDIKRTKHMPLIERESVRIGLLLALLADRATFVLSIQSFISFRTFSIRLTMLITGMLRMVMAFDNGARAPDDF